MGHVVVGTATDHHVLWQVNVGLGSGAEFLGKERVRDCRGKEKSCSSAVVLWWHDPYSLVIPRHRDSHMTWEMPRVVNPSSHIKPKKKKGGISAGFNHFCSSQSSSSVSSSSELLTRAFPLGG